MTELQYQFNYLLGNTGKEQLYYDFQLWYKARDNYWRCSGKNCNSFIKTNGDQIKDHEKKLPVHGHECKYFIVALTDFVKAARKALRFHFPNISDSEKI